MASAALAISAETDSTIDDLVPKHAAALIVATVYPIGLTDAQFVELKNDVTSALTGGKGELIYSLSGHRVEIDIEVFDDSTQKVRVIIDYCDVETFDFKFKTRDRLNSTPRKA